MKNARRSRRAGALCLLGASAALPAAGQAPAEPVAAKVSPVLGQVLGRVLPATHQTPAAEAGLFRRLAQQLAAVEGAASAHSTAALMPALGYAMEQIDPRSFAVLRPIPVAGSGALLRTGDAFMLQFSTSLPGQVRLENVDPQGRVADLGRYTVLVDPLNRIPRDKGIQLQGQPGVERLRFYFYPCLPVESANQRWLAEFQGRLPACPPVATQHVAPAAGSRALGTVRARALVNLNQLDSHLAFAGSNEYQPGEVTLMEAQIRHEGRLHGR